MNSCSFHGCENLRIARSLCHGHYWQLRNGRPLTELRQTRKAVQNPDVPGTYLVPLTRGFAAIIDECDVGIANATKWQSHIVKKNRSIYAQSKTGKLHRAIAAAMGLPIGPHVEIDHIDLNGLNCRRNNLRIATSSQNKHNRGTPRNNTSGQKGVSWHRRIRKWHTKIQAEGRKIHLGYYDDLELAAFVYAEAAHRFHGEFARVA